MAWSDRPCVFGQVTHAGSPVLSQEHRRSDSALTYNFKQSQIDHHSAVAAINLVSGVTKLQ